MLMIDKPVSIGDGTEALHGTLTLPEGEDACDGIVLWSGAGPADRDGNCVGALNSNCLKMLAHALGQAGYAILRADKRGVGESAPALIDDENFVFDDLVDDLIGWTDFLRSQTRINRVFMIGHSEGGLVASLAAAKTEIAGLVLLSALGSPPAEILRRQLSADDIAIPPDLLREIFEIMTALEAGKTVPDVSEELEGQFRREVQPYLISWFAHDPAVALAAIDCPAIVIQGTRDLQVSMEDAERLAAAREDVALVPIAGMNHVLKQAPADRSENFATYKKPLLPLSERLLPAIESFISKL